jgi:hypothetical protein
MTDTYMGTDANCCPSQQSNIIVFLSAILLMMPMAMLPGMHTILPNRIREYGKKEYPCEIGGIHVIHVRKSKGIRWQQPCHRNIRQL